MMFEELFKHDAMKKGLLDQYHIIGILPKNCLIEGWKRRYEETGTWENFMRSKRKRKFFDNHFLEKIKNIVWALSFNMVYVEVYFRELYPLIVEIPERNFIIALSPLNPNIRS